MGGSGSSFLKHIGQSLQNMDSGVRVEEYKNDDPVSDEQKSDVIRELERKNIIVYSSMLKLKPSVLQEQLEAINNATKKNKKLLLIIGKDNPMQVRLAKMNKPNVVAGYSKNIFLGNSKIYYNSNWVNKSTSELKHAAKVQQKVGFWMPCDEDKRSVQVTTHEYGHFVQYNAIKKLIDRHYKSDYNNLVDLYKKSPTEQTSNAINNFYIKLARNINDTIINICKKEYGKFDLNEISDYGQTNQAEFFAEVYANMMLSSKPTNIAKAMKKYLRERTIK